MFRRQRAEPRCCRKTSLIPAVPVPERVIIVSIRVAAVQLEVVLGDVLANLEACEAMARSAAREGAELIVLPEFFTTGVGFLPELGQTAVTPEGAATTMLCSVAEDAGVMIGGSFLCRDSDGEVRNAFVLADRNGVVGRHDKDLPTAWENAFYVGGSDDGVIGVGDLSVGVAMCWEFIRSRTARRLRSTRRRGRRRLQLGDDSRMAPPRADQASRGPEREARSVCSLHVRPIRRSTSGARCHRRTVGVQVARPSDDDLPRSLPGRCDDHGCTRTDPDAARRH